ncbi:hypothetical protein E2562_010510 [Oryza meyeriana var. granulata]|uniref:L-gulonolactone oxidase n=1 Tax=Oryza meyeriana var. granulata TaxID=110450 RepID=A0A6G1DVZ3_9ORYZ|nr:hypothetical protein E2562_010510 [Oryza meyeriana var. granulata]
MPLLLLLLLLLSTLLPTAVPLPPRPPVQCGGGGGAGAGCLLSNAYGAWSSDRADCSVAAVAYPVSEADVVSAVAGASAKNMPVKVVSGFAHTIPKLACPGNGSSAVPSLLISTARYDGVAVDGVARTVTADAGAPLRAVIDAAEASGLSLMAAPYWEGVSVGGLVSTGSHGSSWWGRGGAVHDHVVGLSLVVPTGAADGWAKVMALQKGDALFNAAVVSLGLLGVVSKVTLALEPRFKRSISYDYRDDSTFQDDFANHAASHQFADITWYPSQHQAVYRIDDRMPLNATGDGVNDFIGFQSTLIAVSSGIRALETALEASRNVKGKCKMAAAEIAAKRLVGNGLRGGLLFTGYPVVGFQGRMQTSGSCAHSPSNDPLRACPWDPRFRGLFFYESTAVFSPARFRDFVLDVKRLRDLNPDNMCDVDAYNGLLVRFVKTSEAYLGQPEDSVVVDFNYYRASDPSSPRLNQDVWEEVEQLAFVKHGARPHWAKNRLVAFRSVQGKYPGWAKFAGAKRQLDPRGLFDSRWSDEVVAGKDHLPKADGCALDGRCICSADRHCSPRKGYYCRPGLVYSEARVCRYSVSQLI